MIDLALRGGVVIDGSGAPRRHADIGVDGGRIVAVGDVGAARRIVDVGGMAVAPGIIDIHTHYDAQLCWDPAATPSSIHGVTTVIGGNCGFSVAPLDPTQAPYLSAMLARVEGMPLESLRTGTRWDWTGFAEYLDQFEGRLSVNAGFLVGHTALRRVVLGSDDARDSTDDERAAMVALLRESITAGGLGFSSSWGAGHNDGDGRPVSSRFASRDELLALCAETGTHPGTTLEFIPSIESTFSDEVVDLMCDMSVAADRPLNWNLLVVNELLADSVRQRRAASASVASRGGRVVPLTMPMMSTMRVNFVAGFILDTFDGWTDLFTMTERDRLAALSDPARRAAMRRGVELGDSVLTRRMRDWGNLRIGETFAPANDGCAGRSLAELAPERGGDPFEVLLDIVVADELRTVIVLPPVGNDPASWALRAEVWADERVVIGGSDAGAHLDMMDTFTYSTAFLGPIARDGWIDLEQAVRLLTDVPARLYGIRDRGRVEVGAFADLIVFDPATIGPGPVHTRHDLPGDGARLYADADGIDRVMVRGEDIVHHGELTGALPGSVLRAGRDTDTVRASGPHR